MKFTLYFLKGKLSCAELTVNDIEHCTCDCRITIGEPTEVCLVTSNTTIKNNNGLDIVVDMEKLIEEGLVTKREFETEPIFKDWNSYGLSYTTINGAFVKPPCGKCSQCKCLSDV
jgi:hypothetical protein